MKDFINLYFVSTFASAMDWIVAFGAYLFIGHTFGKVMIGLAFLSDVGRGIRLAKKEPQKP